MKSIDGPLGFLLGTGFTTITFIVLMISMPTYHSYEVNGKQYIVTRKGDTFIKTDSIEITTANGILTIKEK